MVNLTLKEILIYINMRVKMILKNINLLTISTNIGYKKNKKFLFIMIEYIYFNKKYKFEYIELMTHSEINKKEILDLYIEQYINEFENELN